MAFWSSFFSLYEATGGHAIQTNLTATVVTSIMYKGKIGDMVSLSWFRWNKFQLHPSQRYCVGPTFHPHDKVCKMAFGMASNLFHLNHNFPTHKYSGIFCRRVCESSDTPRAVLPAELVPSLFGSQCRP